MASRVLVVEDEPDIRDLLAFHLERDGYQVTARQHGRGGPAPAARHAARPRHPRSHAPRDGRARGVPAAPRRRGHGRAARDHAHRQGRRGGPRGRARDRRGRLHRQAVLAQGDAGARARGAPARARARVGRAARRWAASCWTAPPIRPPWPGSRSRSPPRSSISSARSSRRAAACSRASSSSTACGAMRGPARSSRGRWTCTCAGCAPSSGAEGERILTVKNVGYRLDPDG